MDGLRNGMGRIGTVFMETGMIEITDSPAIRGNQTLIFPFPPEDRIDQIIIGSARNAAEPVIGNHDFLDTGTRDKVLEGRQIGLPEVSLRNDGIEGMAVPFRSGMDRKMFGTGMGLEHRSIGWPLKPPYDRHPQPAGQVRVFPICLHSSSPAGIPENVDIRSPERKSLILF